MLQERLERHSQTVGRRLYGLADPDILRTVIRLHAHIPVLASHLVHHDRTYTIHCLAPVEAAWHRQLHKRDRVRLEEFGDFRTGHLWRRREWVDPTLLRN